MPRRNSRVSSGSVPPSGLQIERSGDVLVFTLDNPGEGNKVTGKMLDAMLAGLRAEALRHRARVLRIRARGKVFCAGRERAGRNATELRRESARILAFKHALRTSLLISVAEVQGDALGFGFGLAILCDFSLVAEQAVLGFPEMRAGLPPSAIMAYLGEYTLPRHAFPLVFFGDAINPQRALQIGLISQVCRAETLTREADALVERILKLDPAAARGCKKFFLAAQQNSFDKNCALSVKALTAASLALLAKEKSIRRDR
jgi:enoyl-CoA hydratase/carnithine racemase